MGTSVLDVLRERLGRSARKKSRDPHWDNIRYLSGTLVVFVHMMNTIADREGLRWLYIATWAMRVPVFVLVAGYFSSAGTLSPREARRLIESILVPYLAIGLLHTLQRQYMSEGGFGEGPWTFFTVEPAWGLWFLMSLLFWRAGLPYLAQLRYPLATSVVVALAAGYVANIGTTLSLSRTLAFLPFFLLGWKIREGLFAGALRARWSLITAWAVLGTAFAVAWVIRLDVKLNWFRMKGQYGTADPLDAPFAWTVRAAVLLAGMVIALSLVRVVPRQRLPFVTYLGAGGLYIYLLHPLVLRPVKSVWGFDWVGPWHEQLLVVLMAVGLSAALASPPVRALARPLVQPRLPWLFRRPEEARKTPAPVPVTPPAGAEAVAPAVPAGGTQAGATSGTDGDGPSTGEQPVLAGPRSG